MKVETLKRLEELIGMASKPQPVDFGDDRSRAFVINGEVVKRDREPAPRKHTAGTLDDLIALANRFVSKGDGEDMPASPVVWYDHEAVIVVFDDADHRLETATLKLEFSDVFRMLQQIRAVGSAGAWWEQKLFIRLLRIELAGTLDPVHLLNAVRVVKFDSGVITRGEVQRNKESLGREIISRVEPSAELPEQVTLTLPVFKTDGLRDVFPIRCTVDVDPPNGKFQLLPLPDEIEGTLAMAVAQIGGLLSAGLDSDVPHYQGKP